MRIGIQACTFDRTGYGRFGKDTYKKLKELGYSCTDFDMCNTNTAIYTASEEESDAMLLQERKLAEEAGIEIFQVHGPWRWPPMDNTEEIRAERMEKMKKSMRMTSLLGCRYWVIHPLMPFGIQDKSIGKGQETWEINIPFMRELLETAKKYDITICLENMPMPEFSIGSPEEILKMVELMNDEHFKVCLDTGHVSVYEDLDLAKEVHRFGSEIRTLHVHDNKYQMDMHLMPYEGVIDWKGFAKALREIGFDGSFSLETGPSITLPDHLFEEQGKVLFHIAEEILK